MASHMMPWLGSMCFLVHTLLVLHQNSVTSFCPSYFGAQEVSVAPKVSATRQVIQIDGLASSSTPITRARGARTVMPQSFCPFNTEDECTLLARGEETTTPQAIKASNFRVPGVHVH
jgi:type IV secretory pathway protease TraF